MYPMTMARALPLGLLMAASLPAAAADMSFDWNLRLRHERVDDDAFARDAQADTARLRAAIRGSFANGLQWLVRMYGSLMATLAQGVVLGAFVHGFAVRDGQFAGGTRWRRCRPRASRIDLAP